MISLLEPVEDSSATTAKILLVDDRPENLYSLEALLQPLGEELVLAKSGLEALKALLRDDFALILMDAEMPEMSGFEAAEMIRTREKNSHVPIIFVTAHGQERKHMFRSYSVGAVDYIPKPFDPDILRSKVKVFVELYKKNVQLKLQTEMLHEIELREAARRQHEVQQELEKEHMRALNEELEKRVAERTAELMAANAEMEAFCYSVSHDLRAPLRAIMATSKMLIQDADHKLTDTEKGHLDRQSKAARRLADLIDDLLQLSRLGRADLRLDVVDLSAIAQACSIEVLQRQHHENLQIEVQPGLTAKGDAGLLRIMLENLLENGCKYSPNGGTIQVGSCTKKNQTMFFVRDQGIGFDMMYAPKVFRPFERLVRDDEYEGTGIGLAIVKRIVERHEGKIWCESAPGEGATFYFTLG
ncbi:MAG: ATP-binding protein [Fimbriimonas sp.]